MRLWISRTAEVPVREQLATQIIFAITSRELSPGERLPSTRALARRLDVHPNTVSAVYRELARRGWIEQRKGSGVFVRTFERDFPTEGKIELDHLISRFLRAARGIGFTLAEIRSRARHWLDLEPPDHFLVVEDDEELRRILLHEIGRATPFRVEGAPSAALKNPELLVGAAPVALYGRSARVQDLLPPGASCLWLRSRSVQDELQNQLRPLPDDALVAVVSRWPEFLRWAKTILLAAGFRNEALVFVDVRKRGWQQSVKLARWIVADSLVGHRLPERSRPRASIFSILPDASIEELRRFVSGIGG